MEMGLKDRVVAVTGGTSGIGLATVRALLSEGARVAFCGRSQERLDGTQTALATDFDADRFEGFACDVLDETLTEKFAQRAVQRFGAVDVLVNNAGQRQMTTFATTSDAQWNEELQLKFFSVIRPTRAFLPMLEQSACGAIVCVNSMLSLQPESHLVATSAARAGVLNMTRSLATEFAPKGVRVNSILLGIINSGQWRRQYDRLEKKSEAFDDWLARIARDKHIPLGRFGRPDEAANAIVFLASPASSYTTGAAIDVSGGVARHI